MAVAFSSSDTVVLEKKIELTKDEPIPTTDIFKEYEIQKCEDWIRKHNLQKVTLQFPDDMLVDSVDVALELEARIGRKMYILGDTSYGSCCVDEIAAEHVSADSIVHFGHSCLSPVRRLPVLYVFKKKPVDVNLVVENFKNVFADTEAHVVVLCDVSYVYVIGDLYKLLKGSYPNIVLSELVEDRPESERVAPEGQTLIETLGRRFCINNRLSVEDYKFVFVGDEGRTLTNLVLEFNKSIFYNCSPKNGAVFRKESFNVNKFLMRRYYLVERAKDAKIVGIVVGTLGVANYMDCLNRLKDLLRRVGKRSYTFVVGKLNVAKLANFQEIDIFVLISCPENILLDSKEFYRPVVTPFEMEVACNGGREWMGRYVTDFRDLLAGGSDFVDLLDNNKEVDVSLITGSIRSVKVSDEEEIGACDGAVVERDGFTVSTVHVGGAGELLASRSWKGLEANFGEGPVQLAVKGRIGIATGYTNEEESLGGGT